MKKILVLLVLFINAAGMKAQDNAYFVAKRLIKIEQDIKERKQVSNDTILKALGALYWYADVLDYDSTERLKKADNNLNGNKYKRLYEIYYTLLSRLNNNELLFSKSKEEVIADLEKIVEQFPDLKSNKTQLEARLKPYWLLLDKRNTAEASLNKQKVDSIDQHKELKLKQALIEEMKIKDSSYKESSAYKVAKDDSTEREVKLKSLHTDIQLKAKELEAIKLKVDSTRQSILQALLYLPGNDVVLLSRFSNINIDDWQKGSIKSEEIESKISAFAGSKTSVQESIAGPQLSFRLPSEAEMIDAVAIYLAKRVKQESVMWFFETIQKNASQYDLLKTFFPNTITLLQSNEVYEIPNLGSQWRYALSKDFVKMPRNVLNSSWFSKWYDSLKINNNINTREFLVAAYDACDLLSQQYSYNQLVKQMYLNLHSNGKEDVAGAITPATVFAILYAFNQECFVATTDSVKTRLMRYEDFRNLSKDELEIMISLMDMKYGKAFTPIWKQTGLNTFLDSKSAETFRRWAGGIETAIEHFNRVQAEYLKLTAEIKDGKKIDAVYSTFNIWENVNSLMKAIIPDTTVSDSKLLVIAKKMQNTKRNMETAFEIYNQLSLKNYAGAVNTTISLVESLLYDNSKTSLSLNAFIKNVKGGDKYIQNKAFYSKYIQAASIYKTLQVDSLLKENGLFKKTKLEVALKNNSKLEGIKLVKEITQDKGTVINVDIKQEVIHVKHGSDVTITDIQEKRKVTLKTKQAIRFRTDTSMSVRINDNQAGNLIYPDSIQIRQDELITALVFDQDRHAINLIRKLAGFLNDVMLTSDSKQLSKVVESYALPPGSYKRKRNSWWSLDLNAYVGAFYGFEKLTNKDKSWGQVYGITAPIGISFSKTFGKTLDKTDTLTDDFIRNPDKIWIGKNRIRMRGKSTWTFTVNVVDIGAVVAYRFDNSDSASVKKGLPQEVKWAQLFSPGAKLSWGIRNTPLVLSAGYQYTPQLRKVEINGGTEYATHRVFLGVLFDLPLVNLHQQSYRKGYYLKK